MRFVQFEQNGERYLGLELGYGGDFLNLNKANSSIPRDMRSFIEKGNEMLQAAKRAEEMSIHVVKRDSVKLLAPITNCEKVLCVGMNYKDHCNELGATIPKEPLIFNKFPSCIIGPWEDLLYPRETKELDWEVELAIVVGRKGKDIQVTDAMDYVFGYTVANDVTARDWQLQPGKNGGQITLAKAMDNFCPLGPAIVTKNEIMDPHNLDLRIRVNGATKQASNTYQLIFQIQDIIVFITRFFTIKPGDLILTGSPAGQGAYRKPPEFMEKGDIVEVEIDEIGILRNKII